MNETEEENREKINKEVKKDAPKKKIESENVKGRKIKWQRER